MVEEGRDCSEVLIQLSAVKSAINNTGKVILQDHIEHCIVDAVQAVSYTHLLHVVSMIVWPQSVIFIMKK